MSAVLLAAFIVWIAFIPGFAYKDWSDSKDYVHTKSHSVALSLFVGALWPVDVLLRGIVWLADH